MDQQDCREPRRYDKSSAPSPTLSPKSLQPSSGRNVSQRSSTMSAESMFSTDSGYKSATESNDRESKIEQTFHHKSKHTTGTPIYVDDNFDIDATSSRPFDIGDSCRTGTTLEDKYPGNHVNASAIYKSAIYKWLNWKPRSLYDNLAISSTKHHQNPSKYEYPESSDILHNGIPRNEERSASHLPVEASRPSITLDSLSSLTGTSIAADLDTTSSRSPSLSFDSDIGSQDNTAPLSVQIGHIFVQKFDEHCDTTVSKLYHQSSPGSSARGQRSPSQPHSSQESQTFIHHAKRSSESESDAYKQEGCPASKVQKLLPKDLGENGLLLACPFRKYDNIRHRNCRNLTLRNIARVTQHLTRYESPHRIPLHCSFCYEIFQDERRRTEHERQRLCAEAPERNWEGYITTEQKQGLKAIIKKNKSVEENWYNIFEYLFPLAPTPSSPYADVVDSGEISEFLNFVAHSGPDIITEVLQQDRWNAFSNPVDDFRSLLDESTRNAISLIVERYESTVSLPNNQFENSNTYGLTFSQSNNIQPSQNSRGSFTVDNGTVVEPEVYIESVTAPYVTPPASDSNLANDLQRQEHVTDNDSLPGEIQENQDARYEELFDSLLEPDYSTAWDCLN